MRTRVVIALLACAAIAGCGSSNSGKSSSSSGSSSSGSSSSGSSSSSQSGGAGYGKATKSTAAAAGAGGTVQIKMQNIAFAPTSVTVKKGQKVVWVNQDTVDHNVTSSDGTLKSNTFGQGGKFTWTANKTGTISYVCTIHPGMKATITVQ